MQHIYATILLACIIKHNWIIGPGWIQKWYCRKKSVIPFLLSLLLRNRQRNENLRENLKSTYLWIMLYVRNFLPSILGGNVINRKNQPIWNHEVYQFSSVPQSCLTLCDPMNHSTPGLPVHHQLPEFTQTHIHQVSDAIQPSHPLSSPSPPAPKPSQHQSLFQWVNSSPEVAKVLYTWPKSAICLLYLIYKYY